MTLQLESLMKYDATYDYHLWSHDFQIVRNLHHLIWSLFFQILQTFHSILLIHCGCCSNQRLFWWREKEYKYKWLLFRAMKLTNRASQRRLFNANAVSYAVVCAWLLLWNFYRHICFLFQLHIYMASFIQALKPILGFIALKYECNCTHFKFIQVHTVKNILFFFEFDN